MLKEGNKVIFTIGNNGEVYTVISDQYELKGRAVVDLEGYYGEVATEYLKVVLN